jgi:ribosomal protein S18 acetylase RimI-like enzyme
MTTPKITLEPMTDEEFKAWVEPMIRDYAEQHVASGDWAAEDALELARTETVTLLPGGVRTKGHHLYTTRDAATGEHVGVLWINIRPKVGKTEAFIYDIVIDEDRRGRGYGRATMLACVERARELGADSVGLHVFGDNTVARGLYRSLGFAETSVQMSLPLEAETATEAD